ncbi:MAG: DUF3422 family protein [Gammaproteobacteria bacterium]|nr:DUF3422 domain-containing protein [Gammaproteobacteria bacterium]MBM4209284.1 DUF3422 domain-containing protein [Gammaproteobacteria bacterium]
MLPTASHPLREELHDEVHARPPLPVASPSRVTCLALLVGNDLREREWQGLRALGARFGVALAEKPAGYFSADFTAFRLKWERHTEFSRYVFVVDGASIAGGSDAPFAHPAVESVPADWLAVLPGQIIFAGHAEIIAARSCDAADLVSLSRSGFGDRPLVGSTIADDKATALTDFRIDEGGYSRLLLIDRGLTPAQAGRVVQSLLEIDLYRMLALLAFPVARQLAPLLSRDERELATIADLLVKADAASEPLLLDRLTSLQAEIERCEADHHYRFRAAEAYHEIVQGRLAQMREQRLGSLQTWQEFMERRLGPAMNTCNAAMAQLESLSQRVTRATQLLSTRIGITRELQNQQLLESMNQRAAAQLRLQATVEGLSVAAVTYYIVGLVKYLADGLADAGWPIDAGIMTAISIPLVAALVYFAVRRVRRSVAGQTGVLK